MAAVELGIGTYPANPLTLATKRVADVASRICPPSMSVDTGVTFSKDQHTGVVSVGMRVHFMHKEFPSLDAGLMVKEAKASSLHTACVNASDALKAEPWYFQPSTAPISDEQWQTNLFRQIRTSITKAASKLRKAKAKAERLQLKVEKKEKTKGAKGKRLRSRK
jgi:hypothetical protein